MVGLLLQDSDYSESLPIRPTTRPQSTQETRHYVRACVALIVVTVFERCAYYSITLNLAYTLSAWYQVTQSTRDVLHGLQCSNTTDTYDTRYGHMDTTLVVVLMILFYLLCSFCSIIGGWLGDGKLGRFKTIRISLLLYLYGTVSYTLLLFVCMCNETDINRHEGTKSLFFCPDKFLRPGWQDAMQVILLALSFTFMALGYGFFKPNIAPFGADQMREYGAEQLEKFYLWFYLFTNIGSLMANCVAFMQVDTVHLKTNNEYSKADVTEGTYLLSYILTVVFILLCIIVFHAGSSSYVKKEPSVDAFKTFFGILKEYISHWNVNKTVLEQHGGSRLELIKRYNGGPYDPEDVEAFKDLWRIVPIMFTLLVYWIIYSQFNTFYYFQGFYLERPDWMPLSVVQLFNPLLITLFVPLLKNLVYPYLNKKGLHMSAFTRIMIGFALITLSLTAATIVAVYTRWWTDPTHHPPPTIKHYFSNHSKDYNYTTYIATGVSIFITSPQIIFISLSEVFVIIAGMEFVYLEAPKALKSFAMGLFFAVNTLGDLLAIILVVVVKLATSKTKNPWICNNLNQGHIDYFYIVLQGLMLVNMLVMWKLSKNFRSNYYY